MLVGLTNCSDSDIAGSSTGKPPACQMPRLISSTRWGKCVWHCARSLHVLMMPITGLPRKSSRAYPICSPRERWPNARRSVAPNQRWLRRSSSFFFAMTRLAPSPLPSLAMLAPFGLPPGREIGLRLLLCGRIEAEDGAALHPLFGDEVLQRGHLGPFVGNLVGKMRGQDHDAVVIADDDVPGPDRRVAAPDRHVELDGLMQRQIGRRRRPMVEGRHGKLRNI